MRFFVYNLIYIQSFILYLCGIVFAKQPIVKLKQLIFFSFLLAVISSSAQVVFNTSYHNFGVINQGDLTYYDFEVTNASKKAIYLLRADEPYAIKVLFSAKKIEPDSSAIIRIKYTPVKKGNFKKEVPIWVSSNNEPILFTLEGNSKYGDVNESLECPDFSVNRKPVELNHSLTVQVIDKISKEPIKGALVDVIWDGLSYKRYRTGASGVVSKSFKQDLYYIVGNAEGYKSDEASFFLNKKSSTLVLELLPKDANEKDVPVEDSLANEPLIVEVNPDDAGEELKVEEPKNPGELSRKEYAPNNVVFLIDVSTSMKQQGRLDLLKASIIELLKLMRDIDRISLVTYSSEAIVILEGISGNNKQTIMDTIRSLKAGGYTAGAKGIEKAYEVAEKHFIPNGNNQVIISTDGAFKVDGKGKGQLKDIEKHSEKSIYMSVVGIKNEKYTIPSMESVAKAGKGNYINISTYEQTKSVLLEEIKAKSKINP